MRRSKDMKAPCQQAPRLDALEARVLLSAELLDSGVLVLTGTNGDDAITIEEGDAPGEVRVYGVDGVESGTLFSGVGLIRIGARLGDDLVNVWGTPRNERANPIGLRIFGGAGDDLLYGGPGSDVIRGGSGRDMAVGLGGDDRLIGGRGPDVLVGQEGDDVLRGGQGDDILLGGEGRDRLFGGPGNDRARGGLDDDVLGGGPGRDDLCGGAGIDVVAGQPGADRMRGPVSEWQDFASDDLFWTDRFDSDPFSVTLPDSLWQDLERFETRRGDLPDSMWRAVDALQTSVAASGAQIRDVVTAVGLLSPTEQLLVRDRVDGAIAAALDRIDLDGGSFDAPAADRLLADVRSALPADTHASYDEFVERLKSEQAEYGSLTDALAGLESTTRVEPFLRGIFARLSLRADAIA